MVADAIKNVDENGRPYTKTSPVNGFRSELIDNNQGGDVYHHVLFVAGGILMAQPLLSAGLAGSDLLQATMQGRRESRTELRDDAAGAVVGADMRIAASTRNFDRLRQSLMGTLCTH